ncbi:MAG: hypothetical protein ACXWEO_02805 [Methylobacter sp.]
MSTSLFDKVMNDIHAQRAYGVLKLVSESLTEPRLKDEDENIYYAIECACSELLTIRKAAEDYLNESHDNAINAFTIMSTPKQEV